MGNVSFGCEALQTPSSNIGRFEHHIVVQPTLGSQVKYGG